MTPLLSVIAAPLTSALVDLVRRHAEQRLSEKALRSEIDRTLAETLGSAEKQLLRGRRDVLLAEIAGTGWLQRNWRPLVALTSFLSYWYVIVVVPHLVAWELTPALHFGERGLENLHILAMLSVGGYMGARTVEKIAGLLRRGRID